MKFLILTFIAALLVIFSCNAPGTNKFLRVDNIPLQEYSIDINKDTTLVTKNGALLKIQKSSLRTDNGNTVTLEIKEAYSISQMIQAGLTTQSNGDPLSSGGMIYVNAKAGQDVTITQAIKVAIPTNYLNRDMQLFKGDKDAGGTINWKEPITLPENKQLNAAEEGQILFQSKCGNCHAIGKDVTGPNLAHFMKRFAINEEGDGRHYDHGFYQYKEDAVVIFDSLSVYDYFEKGEHHHPDPYFIYKCNLINKFGSRGPALFSNDTSDGYDLLNIYRYIQNESDKRNLPLPTHAYLKDCADSCVTYKQTIADLTAKKEAAKSKRKGLVKENGALVDIKPDPTWETTNTPPPDFDEKVSPKNYDAEYYQFTIESFGWYNIDMMLKGVDGVEESELFVRIVGQYREKIKLFLIIPSVKVYGEGGPAERDAEKFAFFYKNGKLPLPQNAEAYILAVTETEESMAFGLKKFNTTTKQELEISLNQSTKEEFAVAINNLNADKLQIKVADSKNAAEVRKTDTILKNIDKELKNAENLKPKGCDCDCGFPKPDQTVISYESSRK